MNQSISNLSPEQKRELLSALLKEKANKKNTEFPLSYGQKALWFLYQLDLESAAYNLMYAGRLRQNIEIDVLKQALEYLVQRHPALRTTYRKIEGEPIQKINSNFSLAFTITDCSNWNNSEIQAWIDNKSDQPFNLEDGVFRVDLLTCSEQSNSAKELPILLLTVHHIAAEFWSLEILLHELQITYNAFEQKQQPYLPLISKTYREFVQQEAKKLASDEGEKLWNYWQQQLSGELPVINLPTDFPRPKIQTYNGKSYDFELGEQLSNQLRELAKSQGVTLYTLVLTAFQVLLFRYCNQEDILIGTPLVSRNNTEFEKLIGYFVNLVVIRATLSGGLTFKALLGRVQKLVLEALQHQDYPFSLLVDKLQIERDTSRSPLVQVSLAWEKVRQQVSLEKNELRNNLIIETIKQEQRGSDFDLTLTVFDTDGTLKCSWGFNTDLFQEATLSRMTKHWQVLLQGIVENIDENITRLPILTESEKQQISVEWNNTTTDYPVDKCIHQLFEEQVERTPDAVAVVYEQEKLTYKELNQKANQLAHYLQKWGVKPNSLVGICVERSMEMIIGLLGILKAGGAYVPLDPNYPQERLAYMLLDSQVSVLLTQERFVKKLLQTPSKIEMISLDRDWDEIAKESEINPKTVVTTNSLVYVIYTSGSTGQPKGVMIEHQSLVNFRTTAIEKYQLTPQDRILQFASLSFDVAAEEIYPSLTIGARVVLISEITITVVRELLAKCEAQKVTVLDLPTAYWQQITLELAANQAPLPASVRLVIIGGEAVSTEVAGLWLQKIGKYPPLINAYGPTETTVEASIYPIDGETIGSIVPIGRPIGNTQIYILNSELQPVPIGVSGELHISGLGIARGYLNRPELTAEKFIPNPFDPSGQSRLYKTGDLCRYLSDGNIEYIGRIDHQIKIRGFRIELGEIESILSSHPDIREIVLIPREDQPGNKQLVAYFVSNRISELKEEQGTIKSWQRTLGQGLREYLQEKLPDYMIPSAFILLEKLPLTPNGKIDRRALPTPDWSDRSQEQNFMTPSTPNQEILATIWREILKVERVSMNDNFFALGGHSLLATQMISRIRDVFGIELAVRALFETPSLKDLSRKIELKQADSKGEDIYPLHPFSRPEKLPLSSDQQRLWFLNQLTEGSLSNNNLVALHLEGTLNVDVLKQSLQELYQRHESLRTYFPLEIGQPVQKIASDITVTLPTVDLQGLTPEEQEQEVERISNEAVQYIFNLAQFPLVRARLLTLQSDSHLLLLTLHHIIFDHISSEMLIKELSLLYSAFSQNQLSPLSELNLQFADFTLWQLQSLESNQVNKHLQYWRQKLANIPSPLALPFDQPRPKIPSFQGRIFSFRINAETTQALQSLSQRTQVTLSMTLMAGFYVLLHRLSNQDDIIIGTPFANRNRTEFESIIGFFATPLPLRIQFSENLTFQTLLQQVRQSFLDAYTHQAVPLAKIAELVPSKHGISYNPLFQVLFTFLGNQMESIKLPELVITPKFTATQVPTELDLILNLYQKEDYLEGIFAYQEDLFTEKTIQFVADFYCKILQQSVDLLGESVSHFSLPQELENKIKQARYNSQQKLTIDIAITSTFTSEPIETSLSYWLEKLAWKPTVKFAPYNQIFQELLNPNSLINQNQEGVNLLLVRLEDWLKFEQNKDNLMNFETKIRQNINDLIIAIQNSSQSLKSPLVITICPPSPSVKDNLNQRNFLSRMEALLVGQLRNINGVNLITSKDLEETYPLLDYYDANRDELGHIPYTEPFYAALGTIIARKIYAIKSPPYKVIALDCDNTLWQGVCGEDGATGVIIDESRKILQEFIIEQEKAGKLLCLCSKNQEEDVWSVFEAHPTMPLKKEHLVSWQINWQSKSVNLKTLASELNLGLDSFIFIDDNPVECAEVRANCPEVLTLQLPENSQNIPQFLNHIWAFDLVKTTAEDQKRTKLYQQNQEREKLQQQSLTFSDFLEGLNLNISIEPITPDNLPRVSQLTQRTNQFNLTTIRRSEREIQQLLEIGQLEGQVVAVKDRFGDYGLVGVLFFSCDKMALTIDTFLLSCRVLGRGVEHEMLKYLGNLAQQRNLSQVNAPYYPTAKNQPILDFLESIGKDNQQKSEQGLLFQFPLELIINIKLNSSKPVTTLSSQLSEKPLSETTKVDFQAPWQLLTQIATELVNPLDIFQKIEAKQQQYRSPQGGEFVAPRNEIEQQLAVIWQEVLKINQVGIYDNFLAIGGNSLLATQVISRMRNTFKIDFPLRILFENVTLMELAIEVNKTYLTLEKLQPISQLSAEELDNMEEFDL